MSISQGPEYQAELSVESAIKLKRENLKLSKRELGRRAKLSPAYVQALESGNLSPSFAAFSRLAVELRMSPSEVFVLVQNAARYNKDGDSE